MYQYDVVNCFDRKDAASHDLTDMPPYLALSNTFYSERNPMYFINKLRDMAASTRMLTVEAVSRQWFGPDGDVAVTEIARTPELLALHLRLLESFGDVITLKAAQYAYDQYRPHVSDQPSGGLAVGNRVVLDNFTLLRFTENKAIVEAAYRLRDH